MTTAPPATPVPPVLPLAELADRAGSRLATSGLIAQADSVVALPRLAPGSPPPAPVGTAAAGHKAVPAAITQAADDRAGQSTGPVVAGILERDPAAARETVATASARADQMPPAHRASPDAETDAAALPQAVTVDPGSHGPMGGDAGEATAVHAALPQPAPAAGPPPAVMPAEVALDPDFAATPPPPAGPAALTQAAAPLPDTTAPPARITISRAAAGRIEMHLDPAELGRVRVEMTTGGERMLIHLAVERPETLDLLRRHGEQLLQEFRQAGVAGSSLSFGTWGQGAQQQRPTPPPPPHTTAFLADPLPSLAAQLRAQVPGSGLNLRL